MCIYIYAHIYIYINIYIYAYIYKCTCDIWLRSAGFSGPGACASPVLAADLKLPNLLLCGVPRNAEFRFIRRTYVRHHKEYVMVAQGRDEGFPAEPD